MKKITLKLAALLFMTISAMAVGHAQPICPECGPVVNRPVVLMSSLADGGGNLNATNTTLVGTTLYRMDKRIYVPNGKTLTIERGTIIKADTNVNAASAKALIVCQGGKIMAEGTPSCPIIFTSASDPLNGTKPLCNNMEWGGVILLGKAQNNIRKTDKHSDGVTNVGYSDYVGYIEGLPIPDIRHHYGLYPSDTLQSNRRFYNDDNSGVLRYVSIRFGGSIIGAANEINGLTMGSVGNGTVIDHVEVVSNRDDAFEFFGGTVNVKNLIAMTHGDDAFDWDQSYQGKGQFLYAVYAPGTGVPSQESHGAEIDGNDKDGRLPNSYGRFYNMTVIGNPDIKNMAIEAKAETKGEIVNSIFANFQTAGLRLTKTKTVNYFLNDSLKIQCNSFVGTPSANGVIVKSGTTLPAGKTLADVTNKFSSSGNLVIASLDGFDPTWEYTAPCSLTGKVDQVPVAAATTCAKPADDFFEYAPYRGAFNPIDAPWTKGWTYYSSIGTGSQDILCPTDLNGDGATDVTDYMQLISEFGNSCN